MFYIFLFFPCFLGRYRDNAVLCFMFYIFLFFPCFLGRYRNNAVLCFLQILGADFLQQGIVPVLIAWQDGKCPDMVGIDIHLAGYLPETCVKLTPRTVVVKTQVMAGVGRDGKHPSDLGVSRSVGVPPVDTNTLLLDSSGLLLNVSLCI